jgi:hypothetical protein
MLISSRRAALALVVVVGAVVLAGACGKRPTTVVADHVIVPQATPTSEAGVTTPAVEPAPVPSDTVVPGPAGTSLNPDALLAAATKTEPNTALGAVVFDRTAGQELVSVEPDRQFSSASLVKLLIAVDMVTQGADADDRRKIARMLSMSDDAIASTLWVQDGGPALVTRVANLIGLQDTEPPAVSGQWGEVQLTAHDVVRVYQYVMDGLPPEDHTLIVDALAQAPEYAADDFRQYFGIPDGLNTQWAIKQGWGNNKKTMVLHSTGLVGSDWRYVVVVLTEHPLGSGWARCAKSVTAVAEALDGQLPGA